MSGLRNFLPDGPTLVLVSPSIALNTRSAKSERLKQQYTEIKESPSDEKLLIDSISDESSEIYKSGWGLCRQFLNPFAPQNAGLTLSFINVGIASYFLFAPVSYYLINTLNASAAEYSAFSTLAILPWALKFLFGVLSDTTPILKYRRKSWLLLGWITYILLGVYMSFQEQPSILTTTLIFFLSTCCYLLSDVCTDTLCVERGLVFESRYNKGTLQTSGYTSRAFGSVVGAMLGSLLYNTHTWGWGLSISNLFLLSALIPIFPLLPSIYALVEIRSIDCIEDRSLSVENQSPFGGTRILSPADSLKAAPFSPPAIGDQLSSIWHTLQLQAVYRPMIFLFSFYMMQIPNSAWTNFLLVGLEFSDFQIGMVSVASCSCMWLGMIAWKTFFFHTPWRTVFIYTALINVVFSVMQILLVLRVNRMLGIPDFILALGDQAAIQFTHAIQSMPSSIMFIMLCPQGSEGLTYALLTTVGNLAWIIAQGLGGTLTSFFDVQNATLASKDFSGVLKLTILTSVIQIVPIVGVYLLPSSKTAHERVIARQIKSRVGGVVLVTILVFGLVGSIVVNVYNVLYE